MSLTPTTQPRLAVLPGTFDPITYGHLDVICRGAKIFDQLIVGIGCNPQKKTIFSANERMEMVTKLLREREINNARVATFSGLTVDFVKTTGASAILRGIRTYADFEYEFQLAIANRRMAGVETVFVMASAENSFIRSTLIREACAMGGSISAFVPPAVEKLLRQRLPAIPQNDSLGLGGAETVPPGSSAGLSGAGIE